MATTGINGVTYRTTQESVPNTCGGCVAVHNGSLCTVLCSVYRAPICTRESAIWVEVEQTEHDQRMAKVGPTILLSSGRYFDFVKPEDTPLTIAEIAHALSHLCRFTGHCEHFYSVAQHAVMVSHLVPPEFALHALHHDDVEAVMGDMSTPLKTLLPGYKELEKRIERVIFKSLGLPEELPSEIKMADLKALATEKKYLMPNGPGVGTWECLDGIAPHELPLFPMSPLMARELFLARHAELTGAA